MRTGFVHRSTLAAMVACLLSSQTAARGEWCSNASMNNPVSAKDSVEESPFAASDGAGGALIAWRDASAAGGRHRLQRMNSSGTLQLRPGGEKLNFIGYEPALYPDGAGSLYFGRYRGASRLDLSGKLLWDVNLPLSSGDPHFHDFVAHPGGFTYLYSRWQSEDYGYEGLHVGHINPDGSIGWEGGQTNLGGHFTHFAQLFPDGTGGTVAFWNEVYFGATMMDPATVYSKVARVTANGSLVGTPAVIPSGPYTNAGLVSVPDGTGGAFFCWSPHTTGTLQLLVQKINADGTLAWSNAVAAAPTNSTQTKPVLISDGKAGAILLWEDWRHYTDEQHFKAIYAQRFNASGQKLWPEEGLPVRIERFADHFRAVSDEHGGVVLAWHDFVPVESYMLADIFAQRISPEGVLLWGDGGTTVCNASGPQTEPHIVADGTGGAIVTWHDFRSWTDWSVFASAVDAGGQLRGTPCHATRFADQQTIAMRSGGTGHQELHYNFTTGELIITPYESDDSHPAFPLAPGQWTGTYLYDYGAGAYTQATYTFRDQLTPPVGKKQDG